MNREVLELVADAEAAARIGSWTDALRGYVDAGECCARYQLWRGAQRCFRRALEINLLAVRALEQLVVTCERMRVGAEPWQRYLDAVPALAPLWTSANARLTQLVIDDHGSTLRHPASSGPIAGVKIGDDRTIAVIRAPAFAAIPDPMLLILLRRTLWLSPRENPPAAPPLVIVLPDNRRRYELHENGDWETPASS